MTRDLLYALRRLLRTPGFSAVGVVTLALAIGSHVAIFGFVDALLLRPLPVESPDELVGVYETRDGQGFSPLSLPDARDHRQATRVFSQLAVHYPSAPLSLRRGERVEEVNGSVVSADYFPTLGVVAQRGRFFLAAEDSVAGDGPVAVISHRFWRSRMASAPSAVGSVLEVNGEPFTVVGVAPEGFTGVLPGMPTDVWLPLSSARVGYRWCDAADRGCTWLQMIGRLAPGRTLAEARTEVEHLGSTVQRAHPGGDGVVRGLAAAPLSGVHPAARPAARRLATLLLASVSLLLAVAGTNLAGLLLARGLTRGEEVATRLALGAGRRRIVWLFVAEALILCAAGGAAGFLLAVWLGPAVSALHASEAPIELSFGLGTVLYAAVLSASTALLVGAASGLRASRADLVRGIKEQRRPRLLGALVVSQVALTFVLLTATGLLARSASTFDRIGALDSSRVVTLRLRPRLVDYEPGRAQAFQREAVRRLAALPGVDSVSLSDGLPPLPFFNPVAVKAAGAGGTDSGQPSQAWSDRIGPGLLETLGLSLLSGREFTAADRIGTPPVAVVNEVLARRLWPQVSPLGRRLLLDGRSFEVVGVVREAGYANRRQGAIAQLYTPYWQNPRAVDARVSVRTSLDAASLVPELRRAIHGIDPAVPVSEVETLRQRFGREFAPVYMSGKVLAVSGGLALVLSAVGLYGILSLLVARRTRDIGIRMALGSTRGRIVRWVIADAGRLVALALVVGAGLAGLVGSRLDAYLYGVGTFELPVLASALLALTGVALVATWWPARCASRVDPLAAIRGS